MINIVPELDKFFQKIKNLEKYPRNGFLSEFFSPVIFKSITI